MSGAVKTLKSYGVPVEVHVMSAHRTPEEAARFSSQAKAEGFGVIIAAAGKAAHLAGVLAAHTTLPVIGIPIKSSTLDGLDALLATVQMPKGIPVATVAIDGVEPTLGNTYNGTIRYGPMEHMYTKGEPNDVVSTFLEYIMSDEYGEQMESLGYGVSSKMTVTEH